MTDRLPATTQKTGSLGLPTCRSPRISPSSPRPYRRRVSRTGTLNSLTPGLDGPVHDGLAHAENLAQEMCWRFHLLAAARADVCACARGGRRRAVRGLHRWTHRLHAAGRGRAGAVHDVPADLQRHLQAQHGAASHAGAGRPGSGAGGALLSVSRTRCSGPSCWPGTHSPSSISPVVGQPCEIAHSRIAVWPLTSVLLLRATNQNDKIFCLFSLMAFDPSYLDCPHL